MPSSKDSFLYFGYGSNLLEERIRRSNPSAVRIGRARLKDFRLEFDAFSERWQGSVVTVVPERGCYVWGAVWKIHLKHLEKLDLQEIGYFRIELNVECAETNKTIRCYSYKMRDSTKYDYPTQDKLPSLVYINTMVKGAEESNLPDDYVLYLKKIRHNGYDGMVAYDKP